MDQIHLTGIRAYGYTGLLPEEQTLGQWFEVDVCLSLDLGPAGRSDSIVDTLDYRLVIQAIQDTIRTRKFALIERLATELTDVILVHAPVHQVRLVLSKVAPPIPDFGGQVRVELTRSRPAGST